MPTTNKQGQTVYAGGEMMPAYGTPEYKAIQIPQPAPAPTLVDRYAQPAPTPGVNPNQNMPFGSGPGSSMLMDDGSSREKYRGYAQDTINAIRSQFDRYIQEDTEAKKKLETKAYLMNMASGMGGSPSGGAIEKKAADAGQKKIRQTEQEREATIAKVLADADMRASQEFDEKRREYTANQKDARLAEEKLAGTIRATAEGDIKNYASKYSYDEWAQAVGPQRVQQYMKETGRDEASLRGLFLKSIDKQDLVSDSGTKLADGSVSFQVKVYDENGNITGLKEVARVQGGQGKEIKDSRLTDDGVQILYTDGSYEIRGGSAGGSGGSGSGAATKPIKGAPEGFTEEDIQKAKNLFTNWAATGGYAHPFLYRDAYDDWIARGGDRLTFIKIFPPKQYIDPAHANIKDQEGNLLLPTYLQNTSKLPKDAAAPTAAPALDTKSTSGGRSY